MDDNLRNGGGAPANEEDEVSLSGLAAFFRSTGQPTEMEAGGLWVAETRLSVMGVPGARSIHPSSSEVDRVLRRTGRVAALYASVEATGVEVDRFVLRDRDYGMDSLQRQFRQQTRAALKECRVRPMSWSELGRVGVQANRESLDRQGKSNPALTGGEDWAGVCEVGASVPGLEVMGCFTPQGDLAAYMVTWTHERWCYGLQLCWVRSYRSMHPTHALYFETAKDRIQRADVDAFTVGRQTIPWMPKVDQFKDHAGFSRERCSVGVILHPWWRPFLLNPVVLRLLRGCRRRGIASGGLRNLEVLEAAVATSNFRT